MIVNCVYLKEINTVNNRIHPRVNSMSTLNIIIIFLIFNTDYIFYKTCVKVFPRQNTSIDKEKNPKARFKNEHITVKEIIDSNIQY